MKTRSLVVSALIAGAYLVLTILLAPISYGPVQFRVSEALTLLPLIFPQAVPGLFVGCLLANIFGGYGAVDIIFGSLATLIAALLTRCIGTYVKGKTLKLLLGALPPVIVNAVIIGAMLSFVGTNRIDTALFILYGGQIFLGQAGVLYILGIPLVIGLRKIKRLNIKT